MSRRDLRATAAAGHRLGWQAHLALVLLALVAFLPGFFHLPPIDRDEVRFAQSTRQMLESGNYVDIRFQNETRYKKPIGIYWLQAASVAMTEAAVGVSTEGAISAYRLPSLVAAVVSVVATGAIGALLLGAETGLAAGILMAICLVLNIEARLATTDATLLAAILVAQYALARAYTSDTATPLPVAVVAAGWIAFGVGILVKGPIIVLVVGGTVAGLAMSGVGVRFVGKLRPWLGLAICSAIALPWLVLITLRSHGAFLQQSVGHDLIGKLFDAETAGRLPPGFHTLMFWIGFWPGSLLVLLALPWVVAQRAEPGLRFCLAWAVPTWIAFELPMTKLFHYVLPAYPALAMLGAAWLSRGCQQSWRPWLRRLIVTIWTTISLILCLAIILLPIYVDGTRPAAITAIVALIAAAALVAAVILVHRRSANTAWALALAGPLVMFAAFGTLEGLQRPFLSGRVVAALPELPGCPGRELVSAGFDEPSLVFLTSARTRLTYAGAAAEALAASPCAIAIVEKRAEPAFLARTAALAVQIERVAAVDGLNLANGKAMTLTLFRRSRP